MRKRVRCLLAATSLLLGSTMSFIIPMSGITANANSAQAYWEGVDITGAVVMDEKCPIEVQHEKLVFDIPQFPASYYQDVEAFLAYEASVSATYTFYNPADYTVKATLAFPFGSLPYYAPYIYDEESIESKVFLDTEKYAITIDEKEIEKELRYTLSGADGMFDVNECLPYLGDAFIEDDFYTLDTPVTKYCYEVSGLSEDYSFASFLHNCDPAQTRILWSPYSRVTTKKDGVSLGAFVQNGEVIEIYVFGEELPYTPTWSIYEDGGEEVKMEGKVIENKDKRDTLTFEEFAFSHYLGEFTDQTLISEVDWYNAVVYSLNESQTDYGVIDYLSSYNDGIESHFMRWYQYEIEIPAKGTIVNTVTAPIYPSINASWEPPIYGYTYLLSPAKTWKKFGNLDIEIHTPYYLIDDESGYTKTENGYSLSLNGLPEGELNFTLSSDTKPKKQTYLSGCLSSCAYTPLIVYAELSNAWGCNSIVGVCATYASIGVTAIILFIKKRK